VTTILPIDCGILFAEFMINESLLFAPKVAELFPLFRRENPFDAIIRLINKIIPKHFRSRGVFSLCLNLLDKSVVCVAENDQQLVGLKAVEVKIALKTLGIFVRKCFGDTEDGSVPMCQVTEL